MSYYHTNITEMTSSNEEGYVRSARENGVLTIEFFHPKSNSMPSVLLTLLAQHIRRGNHADTGVIIIKSAGGGAFCAGASFDELLTVSNEEEAYDFFMGFAHVINEMRKSDKLIIARVHGKSVGGGVGIAAAADYAIACEKSEIKLSELSIGIGPFVIGPVVQRKLGISAYGQLAIDAEMWRPAQWAKSKGLFAEVHPTVMSMDQSIERLAEKLATYSPEAMKEMKQALWQGCGDFDDLLAQRAKISGRLIMSDFAREAISRFKKRSS